MDHKVLESEIDWKKVLSDIEKHVDSDQESKRALKKLMLAGCDKERILQDVYLFCGLSPEEVKEANKELADRKVRITKVVKAARTLASEVDHVSMWLAEAGCECHFTPDERKLRSYADFVERIWSILPPQKRMSGRDQHLIALVDYVKLRAHRQHFAEIADLINAVSIGYRSEKIQEQTAADVRKRYDFHRSSRR